VGSAYDSIVAEGCILSGGRVERSILFPQVRINSYAHITDSIIFERAEIGRHAKIRRTIVDKDVTIPEGAVIGHDLGHDRARFHVTEEGLVVLPKGTQVTS
jgi:glucose-1-phosphate adenylyltransferase